MQNVHISVDERWNNKSWIKWNNKSLAIWYLSFSFVSMFKQYLEVNSSHKEYWKVKKI